MAPINGYQINMPLIDSKSLRKYFVVRLPKRIKFKIKGEAPSNLIIALCKSRNPSLNNSLMLGLRKLERRDRRLAINR
jgi:hypothetical protein